MALAPEGAAYPSDNGLAADIVVATVALNKAIERASMAGLKVEVRETTATAIGRRFPWPVVSVDVLRPLDGRSRIE